MICQTVEISAPGYPQSGKLDIFSIGNYREMRPKQRRPLVLICPGGAYCFVSEKEGEPLAIKFLAMGYHVALLTYSVHPYVKYPAELLQLAGAVKYLKDHAEDYFIDPDKIILQGSSAGGHLAASFGCFWNREFIRKALGVEPGYLRPAGLILNYPVITSGEKAHHDSFYNLLGDRYEELREEMSLEKQVNRDTPRTFLWHTVTDDLVPVENSILFTQALLAQGISVELHLYPVGGHGLALATKETQNSEGYGIQEECQSWIDLAAAWMKFYDDNE